jgi:hypothetical protein
MSSSSNLPPVDSTLVPLAQIPTDGQTRVQVRPGVVRDYAAAMARQTAEGGLRFPPVILFTDCQSYWLADGFHRIVAARKAGLTEFPAEVRPGTARDALLAGISANSAHGLPRSNADKRNAVALLLADSEWSQWSDREIGRRCQVSHRVAARLRRASGSEIQMKERKVQRQGVVYPMTIAPQANTAQGARATAAPPMVPATDALSLALPASKVNVFAALGDFEEAKGLFDRLAEVLDRIAQGPAGELYQLEMIRTAGAGQVRFECPALRRARKNLADAQPYCGYCPNCHAVPRRLQLSCQKCGGRGWTTQAAFDSCLDRERQAILRLHRPSAG